MNVLRVNCLSLFASQTHTIPSIFVSTATKMNQVNLSDMRKKYLSEEDVLLEENLASKNPFVLFKNWFETASVAQANYETNAVCLATADKNGKPSARMVLLKSYGPDGFKIFTNYGSRKGKELLENPQASLLFYWDSLRRQIRIEGKVEKVSQEESRDYFEKHRPKKSQLAAAISDQSQVVSGRDELIRRYKELEEKHSGEEFVPKPEIWGGFNLIPETFEFWQGQSNRLHDRIRFRKPQPNEIINANLTKPADDGWVFERLQP